MLLDLNTIKHFQGVAYELALEGVREFLRTPELRYDSTCRALMRLVLRDLRILKQQMLATPS